MPRVKRGVTANARHKKILKKAKGYSGARSKTFRTAKQAVIKAGQYAYEGRKQKPLLAIGDARANASDLEFGDPAPAKPSFLGRRTLYDVSVADLEPYIDWTFFFSTWDLKGKYPKILDDPRLGEAARELFRHGRELLDEIIEKKWLSPRAVYGFWPARRDGDDIVLWTDESRGSERERFSMLRQQAENPDGRAQRSLADYLAPVDSGRCDWLGAFAVTAGHGVAELVAEFEAEHDDYNAIIVKALADRLAEAYAELLHERARREWGHGAEPVEPAVIAAAREATSDRVEPWTVQELEELGGD